VTKPHPSYSRLSRYDCTGLCWLLQGKAVIALTADTATIKNLISGNVTVFPRATVRRSGRWAIAWTI